MLTDKHIRGFAIFYLGCFLLNYLWFSQHGLTFTQTEPVFFLNKPDVSGNLFMLTGIHKQLIAHPFLRYVFDIIFLLLPVAVTLLVLKRNTASYFAITLAIFNMVYCYFLSMMTFVSIEVFVSWMIVPFIFSGRNIRDSYYLLHIVRIIFLLIFVSTAYWKLRAGGIFNDEQMSAILLLQHGSYLSEQPSGWYSDMITWLINNPGKSWWLYFAAFIIELSFIIGFFTKKADHILLVLFCIFVISNYFLMQISYFTWLHFTGCLFLSRLKLRER